VRLCKNLYRAWLQFFAAAGRAIGLGKYANNLVPRRQQRIEMTRCKIGGSRKDNT
jgi:hypothetical protein